MRLTVTVAVPVVFATTLLASELPGRYFVLLEVGARKVDDRLRSDPTPDLEHLETTAAWRHFGYSILAPAVLYTKKHADNPRYRDPAMLALTVRIGDLLASEHEKGKFQKRLDSDWDTYTWLEAYRLLESQLEPTRRDRWKRAILDNIAALESDAAERVDFAWYQSPFIGTSPNHYAQWAQLLYLAGEMFGNAKWKDLGGRILHRFAAVEQSPDGFWGEHTPTAPTIGYDHLTLSAIAMYYEHSKDPAALQAIRRSLTFHENFTYPDGTSIETMNNRNRYWGVSAWSQFAWSHFPDGRRYAEFLARFFKPESLTMDQLGRLAQDALYYHEGPLAPIPQDKDRYAWQMSIPGGVRKAGPWTLSLSGIIETQAVSNQFYVDRQAHLSIFHARAGLIVSGANSKRQPELATLREKLGGELLHLPTSSRLQMSEKGDRLSLAFNSFFADLLVAPPSDREVDVRFVISGKGRPPEEAFATLQLVLHAGETLETARRTVTLSAEQINLGPDEIGGWIRHHGWKLEVDPGARLIWPVYPFNPYQNAPEKTLEHAVAALSVPLMLKSRPGHYVRPNEQQIAFRLTAE
jgi:hypothetical protein